MPELIGGERRSCQRFEIALNVRFSYTSRGKEVHYGQGVTAELSRRGVLFRSDCVPPEGAEITLRLEWPFLLQNVCELEVVMKGRVLRTTPRGTVVVTHGHEFRTCGERSFGENAGPNTLVVA